MCFYDINLDQIQIKFSLMIETYYIKKYYPVILLQHGRDAQS